MKRILYAAAESAPFIKTGGLGSVLGSLPHAIDKEKYDVRLVIPAYECIDEKWKSQMEELFVMPIHMGWRSLYAKVYTLNYQGLICYFIGNDTYFCGSAPYSDMWIDIEKYSFFSKAVLEMLAYLDFDPDIIHCHNWQTGLLPVFLNVWFKDSPFYKNIKTVITIHNLKFQGMTYIDRMKDITGLPDDAFTYDKLEFYNDANMLKGGLAMADVITAVSKSYAQEILRPEYGEGLDSVLVHRQNDLYGIVNGIDYENYNPETDPMIAVNYTTRTHKKARRLNKENLQEFAGVNKDGKVFTMGIVARLTDQKGYDLMTEGFDDLFKKGVQLFVLGSGDPFMEKIFERYAQQYPNQVYFERNYQDKIAKMIYAGCDVTLMPSRFEPCGLNQLMALRYGCVPVVRSTGGLIDTVEDFDGENGTGFKFSEMSPSAFAGAVTRAYNLYKDDEKEWHRMIVRGMKKNFSWKKSAKEYEKLYKKLTR